MFKFRILNYLQNNNINYYIIFKIIFTETNQCNNFDTKYHLQSLMSTTDKYKKIDNKLLTKNNRNNRKLMLFIYSRIPYEIFLIMYKSV